jgi:hypothetical protein
MNESRMNGFVNATVEAAVKWICRTVLLLKAIFMMLYTQVWLN